jgi:hypothetical protein
MSLSDLACSGTPRKNTNCERLLLADSSHWTARMMSGCCWPKAVVQKITLSIDSTKGASLVFLGYFLLALSIPLIIVGWISTEIPYKYFGFVAILFAIIGLAILRSNGIDLADQLPEGAGR